MTAKARSLLHQMTLEHPTQFWNDSCEVNSLRKAIAQGATGATSNPVIVLEAIEADRPRWIDCTQRLLRDQPGENEEAIAWRLVAEAAGAGADLLRPIFAQYRGLRGRLSVQVNPRNFPSAEAMVAQGEELARLRDNMAIKVPAVAAGLRAIEELTARGVVINATVSYSVSQVIAVAEALERGLDRARAAGVEVDAMAPWITIMVGRLDDHLRDEVRARAIAIELERVRWASTAVFRKAYRLLRQRGYRATLLAAAMRSHHHWSEFIGGEVVITIPPTWQDKFNASGVEVRARIDDPVPEDILSELQQKLPDFRRAYEEGGMQPEEFVSFGSSRKTLHQFIASYEQLLGFVRSVMLPLAQGGNP